MAYTATVTKQAVSFSEGIYTIDPEPVKTEVFGILHYFNLKPASGLSPQ